MALVQHAAAQDQQRSARPLLPLPLTQQLGPAPSAAAQRLHADALSNDGEQPAAIMGPAAWFQPSHLPTHAAHELRQLHAADA